MGCPLSCIRNASVFSKGPKWPLHPIVRRGPLRAIRRQRVRGGVAVARTDCGGRPRVRSARGSSPTHNPRPRHRPATPGSSSTPSGPAICASTAPPPTPTRHATCCTAAGRSATGWHTHPDDPARRGAHGVRARHSRCRCRARLACPGRRKRCAAGSRRARQAPLPGGIAMSAREGSMWIGSRWLGAQIGKVQGGAPDRTVLFFQLLDEVGAILAAWSSPHTHAAPAAAVRGRRWRWSATTAASTMPIASLSTTTLRYMPWRRGQRRPIIRTLGTASPSTAERSFAFAFR